MDVEHIRTAINSTESQIWGKTMATCTYLELARYVLLALMKAIIIY